MGIQQLPRRSARDDVLYMRDTVGGRSVMWSGEKGGGGGGGIVFLSNQPKAKDFHGGHLQ